MAAAAAARFLLRRARAVTTGLPAGMRPGVADDLSRLLDWAHPPSTRLLCAAAPGRAIGAFAATAPAPAPATTPTSRAALAKLKVADLKALLAGAGVPASSIPKLKADLVEAAWAAVGGGEEAAAAVPPPAPTPTATPTSPSPSIPVDPVPARTGLAVTWLGTSSGAPTPARNVSSIAARTPAGAVLVDCGEGTAAQAAAAGIHPASIASVLVTHLHGDHCFGLAGLLTTVTRARAAVAAAAGGSSPPPPVLVAGPPGLGALISAALRLPGGLDGAGAGFPARILILEFVVDPRDAHPPRPLAEEGDDAGTAARLASVRLARRAPDRTPAAEAALRARAAAATSSSDDDDGYYRPPRRGGGRDRGGGGGGPPRRRADQAAVHAVDVVPGLQWTLDLAGLAAAGGAAGPSSSSPFPAPPLTAVAAQLQHRVPCWGYALSEVVGGEGKEAGEEAVRPRKVVLLGDTCDSTAMTGPGAGADLLSHEATFAAGMAAKARIAQHSTAAMAGAFAAALDARALVLTHFSSRYATVYGDTGLLRGGGGVRGPGSRSLGDRGDRGGGGGGETAGDAAPDVDAPPGAIRGLISEARRAFGSGLVAAAAASRRGGGSGGDRVSPAEAMEGREVLAATDGFTVHVPR